MKARLKNIATKIFIALMAVQIINLSIDAIEFEPLNDASTGIGDFNYMNSMTEYVVEILLHHQDAFPEYNDVPSSSKIQILKHIPFNIVPFDDEFVLNDDDFNSFNYIHPINENPTCSYVQEINPPPPKLNAI